MGIGERAGFFLTIYAFFYVCSIYAPQPPPAPIFSAPPPNWAPQQMQRKKLCVCRILYTCPMFCGGYFFLSIKLYKLICFSLYFIRSHPAINVSIPQPSPDCLPPPPYSGVTQQPGYQVLLPHVVHIFIYYTSIKVDHFILISLIY